MFSLMPGAGLNNKTVKEYPMNRNTKMAVMTVAITALLAGRAVATEYSVYGYLFTSTGSDSGCNLPVGNIKVDMWDEDYGPDDYCGTDYSSPGYGTFQVNFSDSFESPDEIGRASCRARV